MAIWVGWRRLSKVTAFVLLGLLVAEIVKVDESSVWSKSEGRLNLSRWKTGSGADAVAHAVNQLPLGWSPVRAWVDGSTHGFPANVKLFDVFDESVESVFASPPSSSFSMKMHNATLLGGITAIGEYFTRIYIGGQEFRVQIDTGSSTLAIPLDRCQTCLRGDLRYARNKSNSGLAQSISCESSICGENTCRSVCKHCSGGKCCAEDDQSKCGFFLRYGDGSGAQGALMYDVLDWGGVQVEGIFGGVLRDTKHFEQTGVDGILGLAYAPLGCTPTCFNPVFDLMVNDKKVRNIFGICLYEEGGSITLGAYDKHSLKSEVEWVPMVKTEPKTFYQVPLPGYIGIAGKKVPVPRFRSAIVDSGTTLIVLSHATFIAIAKHLTENFCNVPGLCGANTWFQPAACVALDEAQLNLLPDLTFSLGARTKLVLRPEDYMLKYTVDVILGNTLNMRYVTIYDRENEQMGFAERQWSCGMVVDECELMGSCKQCAAAPNCMYNYRTNRCFSREQEPKERSWLGLPYPVCSSRQCFCEVILNGWVYSLLVGVGMGLVIASVVLLLGRIAYARRNRSGYQEIIER